MASARGSGCNWHRRLPDLPWRHWQYSLLAQGLAAALAAASQLLPASCALTCEGSEPTSGQPSMTTSTHRWLPRRLPPKPPASSAISSSSLDSVSMSSAGFSGRCLLPSCRCCFVSSAAARRNSGVAAPGPSEAPQLPQLPPSPPPPPPPLLLPPLPLPPMSGTAAARELVPTRPAPRGPARCCCCCCCWGPELALASSPGCCWLATTRSGRTEVKGLHLGLLGMMRLAWPRPGKRCSCIFAEQLRSRVRCSEPASCHPGGGQGGSEADPDRDRRSRGWLGAGTSSIRRQSRWLRLAVRCRAATRGGGAGGGYGVGAGAAGPRWRGLSRIASLSACMSAFASQFRGPHKRGRTQDFVFLPATSPRQRRRAPGRARSTRAERRDQS